ncbi:MAG: deoxyribose-phosphate aldolase [Acidobacteria bacterium]|nr:deoxyribose-phosphate aldolase [Acidobacteriota bacterium]
MSRAAGTPRRQVRYPALPGNCRASPDRPLGGAYAGDARSPEPGAYGNRRHSRDAAARRVRGLPVDPLRHQSLRDRASALRRPRSARSPRASSLSAAVIIYAGFPKAHSSTPHLSEGCGIVLPEANFDRPSPKGDFAFRAERSVFLAVRQSSGAASPCYHESQEQPQAQPLGAPAALPNVNSIELDELVAQIGEELLARLGRETPPLAARSGASAAGTQSIQEILAAGADRVSASGCVTDLDRGFAARIDHTLLRPEIAREEILRLCGEAKQFGFASVCVNPVWVSLCAGLLHGAPVKVSTVVGFPLGATLTETKRAETELVIKLGAEEIDMVMPVGAMRSGDLDLVYLDVAGVVEVARRAGAIVKVILETALLSEEEKIRACAVARLAGADFVKTSSGFGPAGATTSDVALMRRVVGGARPEDHAGVIPAVALGIATSASVRISDEARSAGRLAAAPIGR